MKPSTTTARSSAIALALLATACQTRTHVASVAPARLPYPETAAPAVVHAPGPWGVYFDFDQDELRPEAVAILDLVVDACRGSGRSVVTVNGHGDTVGRSTYNVDLGQRRADAVTRYLVSRGVDPRFIRTQTRGERDQMVPTPDDVRERHNRRVEVTFSPV